MKIWQLRSDSDNYSAFHSSIPFTGIEMMTFDGRSHQKDTKIRKVVKRDWRKGLVLGDAPDYIIPVFSKNALQHLMPLIGENIEPLKLDYEEPYYAINVTRVVDAINYGRSEYITFNDSKEIVTFSKYSFLPEKVKGVPIFKISDARSSFPLVSDEFKQIVEANNLKGFVFRLLWDSEKE